MTDRAVDEAPRLPGGSGGFAPRSAADDVLVAAGEASAAGHPTVPLLHAATPRLLTCVGLAVTEGLVGYASWTALHDSDWSQPRPLLDGRMAAAAVFTLVAGLWWAVAGALNARRLTTRQVVGPATAPLGYLLAVASWFGVDKFADGDMRRWAWAGWLAVVLAAHYAVVSQYRTTAATLGQTNSHFTAVGVLPVLAGAISVAAVFQRAAVFGLPVVVALMAWLVIELFQAMNSWDAQCRRRSKALTLDGSVPLPMAAAVASVLGASAPTAPAPAAAAPAPPTAAPVSRRMARSRATLDGSVRMHHTMIPRSMVLASFMLGLSTPAWIALLERKGHLVVSGKDTAFDAVGRRVVLTLAFAFLASYAIGWLWWSVAAALNAAGKTRWTVSPWVAPFGYLVIVALAVAVPVVVNMVESDQQIVVVGVGAFLMLIAHFSVLSSYRRTAQSIGAAVGPWTRVIALPWIAIVFSVVAMFFAKAVGDRLFELVLQIGWVLFYAYYAFSFYQAMSLFDRACVGRKMAHDDFDGIPEFLKKSL